MHPNSPRVPFNGDMMNVIMDIWNALDGNKTKIAGILLALAATGTQIENLFWAAAHPVWFDWIIQHFTDWGTYLADAGLTHKALKGGSALIDKLSTKPAVTAAPVGEVKQ